MSSLFESTYNTRAIISGSLKYIRSDAPYKLTDDELDWLRANNITTVIDLRSESECKACPSILASAEGFSYRNMPVSGGNAVPKTPVVSSVIVIGAITFVTSLIGVGIGNRFGSKYEKKAELVGGIVLVLIGVKLLLDGLGIL